jgi:transcription elongation factor Elf1
MNNAALLLPCPLCGFEGTGILLDLGSLDDHDLDNFTCSNCGRSFAVNDVRNWDEEWALVVAWIDQAPKGGVG